MSWLDIIRSWFKPKPGPPVNPPATVDLIVALPRREGLYLDVDTQKNPGEAGAVKGDAMPSYEREYPEGTVIFINMQGDDYVDLRGSHVHLCPECFEDVPCADTCTWDGESVTNADVPTCHPVICERCETASRLYHEQGGGI